MSCIYHFSGTPLILLAAEALDATQFRKPYIKDCYTDAPAVWLCKDSGVYLLNAHPNPGGRTLPLVARCNDVLDDTDLMGNDYAEHIALSRTALNLIKLGRHGIRVTVHDDDIDVNLVNLQSYSRSPACLKLTYTRP